MSLTKFTQKLAKLLVLSVEVLTHHIKQLTVKLCILQVEANIPRTPCTNYSFQRK